MKLSVIIPVYNVEKFLPDCLDSVLSQDFPDMEILCVDDETPDNSLQILEDYAARDPRIRILRPPHGGLSRARNRGTKEAKGEYITYVDSDDMLAPGILKKAVEKADRLQADVLVFSAVRMGEDGGLLRDSGDIDLRVSDPGTGDGVYRGITFWVDHFSENRIRISAWGMLLRTELFRKHDLRFVPDIYFEDNDWIFRVYRAAERLAILPDAGYYYRMQQGSITHVTPTDKHFYSMLMIGRIYYSFLRDARTEEERRMLRDLVFVKLQWIIRSLSDPDRREKFCRIYDEMEDDEDTALRYLLKGPESVREEMTAWLTEQVRLMGMDRPGAVCGVVGTGMNWKTFRRLIREYDISVPAKILLFDTLIAEPQERDGETVLPLSEMPAAAPDSVVIFSTKFAREIREKLRPYAAEEIVCEAPDELRFFFLDCLL